MQRGAEAADISPAVSSSQISHSDLLEPADPHSDLSDPPDRSCCEGFLYRGIIFIGSLAALTFSGFGDCSIDQEGVKLR